MTDPRENLFALNAELFEHRRALTEALRDIEEIADDRADVDDGIPDDWMRVLVIARAALNIQQRGTE